MFAPVPDDRMTISKPRFRNRRGYGSRNRFQHRLREIGFASYADYLQSERWLALKANWKPRRTRHRRPVCEFCLSAQEPFHLHHKNYSRLGNELTKDLILICGHCHSWIHGWHERSTETLQKITKKVALLARKRKFSKLGS
jgi:hypothetical protein